MHGKIECTYASLLKKCGTPFPFYDIPAQTAMSKPQLHCVAMLTGLAADGRAIWSMSINCGDAIMIERHMDTFKTCDFDLLTLC